MTKHQKKQAIRLKARRAFAQIQGRNSDSSGYHAPGSENRHKSFSIKDIRKKNPS